MNYEKTIWKLEVKLKRIRSYFVLRRVMCRCRMESIIGGFMGEITFMKESEECIGKYATKNKASQIAELETQRTGRKHHAFMTHYNCPYDNVKKICWTVMLSRNR